MSKTDKQRKPYRIYDRGTRQWYEVTYEQYKEFDRWRTAKRKREQYHHRCMCPRNKWWLCDGMCEDCEFRAAGDTLSLDYELQNEGGESFTLLDTFADSSDSIEDIISDKAELEQLFALLDEVMPEARQIGELRLKGRTDTEIAEVLGIKRTTFRSRIEKAKQLLRPNFPDVL